MLRSIAVLGALALALAGRSNADKPWIHNYTAYQASKYGTAPSQRFKTYDQPAPLFNINIWNESLIDPTPYIFFNMEWNDGQGHRVGPYIFDAKDLSMVYGRPDWRASNNARIQQYKGQPVFTTWVGRQGKGHAEGNCIIMDDHYEVMFNISTVGLGSDVDLHECEITHDDTVLVTAYESIPWDLREIGGREDDLMLDSVFQEIRPETNELLFDWHGSQHIPITDSYKSYVHREVNGWEAYHINSLQKSKNGNYFVSFRRTHTLALINGTDGSFAWQLGGKHNDFQDLSDGRATDFAWQHHARFIDNDWTQLTLFDNHQLEWNNTIGCDGTSCSRGMRVELNHDRMTAELKQEYWAPQSIGAYAMGSYDHLPQTGNALIGWGSISSFSEYTAAGECVMDVQFGVLDSWVRTYRVYKAHWTAYPSWPPSLAVVSEQPPPHDDNETTATIAEDRTLYVSWNGATEVRAWAVLAHHQPFHLDRFGRADTMHDQIATVVAKRGFETEIKLPPRGAGGRYVRVVALNSLGAVLGATGVADTETGEVRPPQHKTFGEPFMLEYPHMQ